MKIQCPNCSASYNINIQKVPRSAVKVKCLKCQNNIIKEVGSLSGEKKIEYES
jgi:predicted Zn finger-like uncharacterized protein